MSRVVKDVMLSKVKVRRKWPWNQEEISHATMIESRNKNISIYLITHHPIESLLFCHTAGRFVLSSLETTPPLRKVKSSWRFDKGTMRRDKDEAWRKICKRTKYIAIIKLNVGKKWRDSLGEETPGLCCEKLDRATIAYSSSTNSTTILMHEFKGNEQAVRNPFSATIIFCTFVWAFLPVAIIKKSWEENNKLGSMNTFEWYNKKNWSKGHGATRLELLRNTPSGHWYFYGSFPWKNFHTKGFIWHRLFETIQYMLIQPFWA